MTRSVALNHEQSIQPENNKTIALHLNASDFKNRTLCHEATSILLTEKDIDDLQQQLLQNTDLLKINISYAEPFDSSTEAQALNLTPSEITRINALLSANDFSLKNADLSGAIPIIVLICGMIGTLFVPE